jgi:hypothetical protein
MHSTEQQLRALALISALGRVWEAWNWLMNTLYGVLLEHGKRAFVALIVVTGGGREIWRAFGMWLGGRAGVSSGSIR